MSRYDHYYQSPIPHYDPVRAKFASEVNGYWQEWDGITKLLEFPAVDRDLPTLIAVEHNHGKPHLKIAAPFPPEVRAKIASLEYDPKGLWVVSNAMGSMETWGCNRNGDAFPKLGLSHIGDDYGHKTFEKFAFPYVHHLNKDPKNSIGEKVAFSHWDEEMDKVTLLYKLSRTKAADVCERLDKGESVATSMGCKVPFDVCSVCDHKAKTASEYCEHCKYYPGQMMPSGVKVAMINVFPRFFDQSHVLRGADKIAYAWGDCDPGKMKTKKAYYIPSAWRAIETPGYIDFANATILAGHSGSTIKTAAEQPKNATITKEIPSQLEKAPEQPKEDKDDLREVGQTMEPLEDGEPEMSPEELQELLGVSIEAVLGTTSQHGMVLTPEEFQQMSLTDAGKPEVAERLRKNGWSLRDLPQGPVVLHKVANCRAKVKSDDWVVQCPTCKYANEIPQPPTDSGALPEQYSFWDLGPEVINAVLAWTDPQAGQYDVPPAMQQAMPSNVADASQWKVSAELNQRLSREFIEKRSAFTFPLYRRMLSKIANHCAVHEVGGPAQGDPSGEMGQGPVKIIVIQVPSQEAQQPNPQASMHDMGHNASPHDHHDLKDMTLARVLYALYRNGLSGLIGGMPMKTGYEKRSAVDRVNPAFQWAHGVPTQAYLKYAYRWKHPELKGRIQPGKEKAKKTKKASLVCDSFLLDELIAGPLLNHEKVASILAFAPDELIDAATLVGLTYVRDLR